ncbi:hypothetical protein PG995_007259 [Apiospora arundinis]|uniref:Uncharacterized protein n=1 Tax=Apiospora arundinis TaxID=335852 RepID=A0ABR2JGV1_9PEZI
MGVTFETRSLRFLTREERQRKQNYEQGFWTKNGHHDIGGQKSTRTVKRHGQNQPPSSPSPPKQGVLHTKLELLVPVSESAKKAQIARKAARESMKAAKLQKQRELEQQLNNEEAAKGSSSPSSPTTTETSSSPSTSSDPVYFTSSPPWSPSPPPAHSVLDESDDDLGLNTQGLKKLRKMRAEQQLREQQRQDAKLKERQLREDQKQLKKSQVERRDKRLEQLYARSSSPQHHQPQQPSSAQHSSSPPAPECWPSTIIDDSTSDSDSDTPQSQLPRRRVRPQRPVIPRVLAASGDISDNNHTREEMRHSMKSQKSAKMQALLARKAAKEARSRTLAWAN